MSRFVVLLHRPGAGSSRTQRAHADWMFQCGDVLATWATDIPSGFCHSFCTDAQKLDDHRLHYLDHEGAISDGRGDVTRLLSGYYDLVTASESEFSARLGWITDDQRKQEASVRIQRRSRASDEESRVDLWELRFDFGRNDTNR